MRGVYFFATGNDLFELLKEINKSMPIEFVKSGSYNSKQDIVKRIVSELANISTNTSGEHQSNAYLVVPAGTHINYKTVNLAAGGTCYHVYQSENSSSISLWPGGFYDRETLIVGHFDTLFNTLESQQVYQSFSRFFKKRCTKIRGYYFGKEALEISKTTRLVTISVKSPPEYAF